MTGPLVIDAEPLIIDTDCTITVLIIPPVRIAVYPDILIAELDPVYQHLVTSKGPVHTFLKSLLTMKAGRPHKYQGKQ